MVSLVCRYFDVLFYRWSEHFVGRVIFFRVRPPYHQVSIGIGSNMIQLIEFHLKHMGCPYIGPPPKPMVSIKFPKSPPKPLVPKPRKFLTGFWWGAIRVPLSAHAKKGRCHNEHLLLPRQSRWRPDTVSCLPTIPKTGCINEKNQLEITNFGGTNFHHHLSIDIWWMLGTSTFESMLGGCQEAMAPACGIAFGPWITAATAACRNGVPTSAIITKK